MLYLNPRMHATKHTLSCSIAPTGVMNREVMVLSQRCFTKRLSLNHTHLIGKKIVT